MNEVPTTATTTPDSNTTNTEPARETKAPWQYNWKNPKIQKHTSIQNPITTKTSPIEEEPTNKKNNDSNDASSTIIQSISSKLSSNDILPYSTTDTTVLPSFFSLLQEETCNMNIHLSLTTTNEILIRIIVDDESKETDTVPSDDDDSYENENETEEHYSSTSSILYEHTLIWPCSILSSSSITNNRTTMAKKELNATTLHSIALFRHNNTTTKNASTTSTKSNNNNASTDMMNIVNDLSSLWSPTTTSTKSDTYYFDDANTQQQQTAMDESNPPTPQTQNETQNKDSLYFACLDSNYILYFYTISQLVHPSFERDTNTTTAKEEEDIETLFLGSALLKNVRDSIGPLSNPFTKVYLSSFYDSYWSSSTTATSKLWNRIMVQQQQHHTDESNTTKYDNEEIEDVTYECMIIAFDYVVIGGTRRRRNRKHTPNESIEKEGIVTFVSLRNNHHYHERKTIVIPNMTSPYQFSTIHWNGISFLVIHSTCSVSTPYENMDPSLGNNVFVVRLSEPNESSFASLGKIQMDVVADSSSNHSHPNPYWKLKCFQVIEVVIEQQQLSAASTIGDDVVNETWIGVSCHNNNTTHNASSITPGIILYEPKHGRITLHSFHKFEYNISSSRLILRTVCQSGHWASVPPSQSPLYSNPKLSKRFWCLGGEEGWSILGVASKGIYFITWEGATTLHGSYIHCLIPCNCDEEGNTDFIPCMVLPHHPNQCRNTIASSAETAAMNLNINPFRTSSYFPTPTIPTTLQQQDAYDPFIERALKSMTATPSSSIYTTNASNRPRALSKEDKSKLLLNECPSWKQLESSSSSNQHPSHDDQIIIAFLLHPSTNLQKHKITSISLRKKSILNAVTPFGQILSWMVGSKKDYDIAASIALILLDDIEALHDLRCTATTSRSFYYHDNENDPIVSLHEGLLDGILPPESSSSNNNNNSSMDNHITHSQQQQQHTANSHITFLADMAVGCLIKGGSRMFYALDGFLSRNIYYDASKTCLMLAATTAITLPDYNNNNENAQENVTITDDVIDQYLWPIQCLMTVAIHRNAMSNALILLNAVIPLELRRCLPTTNTTTNTNNNTDHYYYVCDTILRLIMSSNATHDLLSLTTTDYHYNTTTATAQGYWQSLTLNSQLAITLLSIADDTNNRIIYPFLCQYEVRTWVLNLLNRHIHISSSSLSDDVDDDLPTDWIANLCIACLSNSGCHWDRLLTTSSSSDSTHYLERASTTSCYTFDSTTTTVQEEELPQIPKKEECYYDDGLDIYHKQIIMIRDALKITPTNYISQSSFSSSTLQQQHHCYGHHDFNLLIASLLLLQLRDLSWSTNTLLSNNALNNSDISTQSLLNQVCYLAGTPTITASTTASTNDNHEDTTLAYNNNHDTNPSIMNKDQQQSIISSFPFQPSLAMKQCATSNNIISVANLIGGKDGFILKCAHILITASTSTHFGYSCYTMEQSLQMIHSFINTGFVGVVPSSDTNNNTNGDDDYDEDQQQQSSIFILSTEYKSLIALLDDHVLSITKFGDFDDNNTSYNCRRRGHVDPVFAARLCFYIWLLLLQQPNTSSEQQQHQCHSSDTINSTTSSISFLTKWLRHQLHLTPSPEEGEVDGNEVSMVATTQQRRLPSAAILRALLWNEGNNTPTTSSTTTTKCLAQELQIDSKFLLQLAQSCCGLVECLPKNIALKAMQHGNIISTFAAL